MVLAFGIFAIESGCVQRRMTIRSNPPGAMVYVDDYPLGPTPISTDFTYYGTRKIRLVKDGYETLTVMQPFPMPWYQVPPADFITENLVPGQIRDQRLLDYQLKPQMVVPTEQLLARAETLRRSNMAPPVGPMVPQPGMSGPMTQTVVPGTIPGSVPNTMPGTNQYQQTPVQQPNMYQPPNGFYQPNTINPNQQPNNIPQPDTSVPPGYSGQPDGYQPPNLLTPANPNIQQDIGGQGVHQLPPR